MRNEWRHRMVPISNRQYFKSCELNLGTNSRKDVDKQNRKMLLWKQSRIALVPFLQGGVYITNHTDNYNLSKNVANVLCSTRCTVITTFCQTL